MPIFSEESHINKMESRETAMHSWGWGKKVNQKRVKKNLVLIMCLRIGEVAHTDTLLPGTWL